MIAMTQKVYNEVLDLPAEERLELVDMLLKNLTPVNDSIDYFDHCCNEFAQVSILLGESNLAFTIGSHEIRNRLEAIL
ncbi:MAG: hypothetical protein WCP55_09935 [Lentisphaerota bacterium]